ncbi:DUF4870 domain-containing protein [Bacillus sp. DX4.1]|uniref:DUF4870 domain-containing protein n=1 Tax=Bacillus sp. DX4.1 TaxID=3055867 RepID=UPI0025A1E703|nr:DUF4870 domain-containing protein [Bacillus sp. DX4.1]MDM5188002.1 DUF4870 domain-containing protein [Bacillus sp. DX4.1]
MKGNNILSSLNYFSIFFAPLFFPIIIYFLAEEDVKYHAKKALETHLVPYITLFIGIIVAGISGFYTENVIGIPLIITLVIAFVINIYYFIWNIVKGFKVLKKI